jgi:hypothetical protein
MIFEANRKVGSLGPYFVSMDIGSSKRLAMQDLEIADIAETGIIPKWLFPPPASRTKRG